MTEQPKLVQQMSNVSKEAMIREEVMENCLDALSTL